MGLVFLTACSHELSEEKVQDTEIVATQETVDTSASEDTEEYDDDHDDDDHDDDDHDDDDHDDEVSESEQVSTTTSDEVVAQTELLDNLEEDTTKTVTLDAAYSNPKGPVDMKINYTLSADGTIDTIAVSATTYDVAEFNSAIQSLVWKTLEDAANYKTGSSLTGDAFKSAIKEQL